MLVMAAAMLTSVVVRTAISIFTLIFLVYHLLQKVLSSALNN